MTAVTSLKRWFWTLTLGAVPVFVHGYLPPAGIRSVAVGNEASILPGGRVIRPIGEQHEAGFGPMGLALSSSGKILVSANLGPGVPSLTVFEHGRAWDYHTS